MTLRFFFLNSFLFLLFVNNGMAQKRSMDTQMRDFLNTPFMMEYQKLQLEMRGLVKDFMEDKAEYSTTDFRKVRNAYNQTSQSFNEVLFTIETDMLNKNTRRTMQRSPDLYHSKLQLQMANLKDLYATEFLQTLSDVRGEPMNGGPILLTLTTLTQLTVSVIDFFIKSKWQAAQFNQAFVRDRLVTPYSFPNWNQMLQGMNGGAYVNTGNDNTGGNNGYGDYNTGGYNNSNFDNNGGYNTGNNSANNSGGYDQNSNGNNGINYNNSGGVGSPVGGNQQQ